MTKAVRTIGVPTSGDDTPEMNAAIRAVVRTAISKGLKVKGIMHEYAGLLEEEIADVESTGVSGTINRGGTILYTARYKEFATTEGQQKGANIYRKHGIGGMMVIGGDDSFRGAGKLSFLGINTTGLPKTINLGIACTDYAIGFDTAVNTAAEAIDKTRNASTSHERCSIVEAMGRNTGYITLWYSVRNGAEDILLPEHYDGNEQTLINRIIGNRRWGKKYNIIINTEGTGHSGSMVKCIEAATGIEVRATTLGHVQRGGAPTCEDRVYASIMKTKTAGLLTTDKNNRLVAYKHDEFVDFDIQEALNMTKDILEEQYEIARMLIR